MAPDTDFTKQMDSIELTKYGILTKVNDVDAMVKAMKLLYNDTNLRYNYMQKAKERIKNFEVNKIIAEWERIINGN